MDAAEGVRQRKRAQVREEKNENIQKKAGEAPRLPPQIDPGSYWLTRIVFLRFLGFIYCK